MSKSASLPAQPFDDFESRATESAGTPAWKQEVNQRLAAHRTKRAAETDASSGKAVESPRTASARAAEAAARVAARYAKAPSYSQLLAGEARAVVRAAGAAAEAARNAQAAAQAVLAGLEAGTASSEFWEGGRTRHFEETPAPTVATHLGPARWQDEAPVAEPTRESPRIGAQPRWDQALPGNASVPGQDVWSEMRVYPTTESSYETATGPVQEYRKNYTRQAGHESEGELFPVESFDSYASFDAMGSATVEPVQHLPANLIEFPRELTATRKARPRLAEGPFYDASHENSQLSIFEVDPELLAPPLQMSESVAHSVAPPEWASIELDHHPERHYGEHDYVEHAYADTAHVETHYAQMSEAIEVAATVVPAIDLEATMVVDDFVEPSPLSVRVRPARKAEPSAEAASSVELLVAPLSDRLLATVVDGALVTLAFLAAAVVVIASTAHPPTGRIALIASGCGLAIFGLLYQFLFLSYAEEGTPGMRYARIALCTFDDDNPSREQMRMRIPAMLVAAVPAGLGMLWAMFDADHLGWHDRLTKTYQRKY